MTLQVDAGVLGPSSGNRKQGPFKTALEQVVSIEKELLGGAAFYGTTLTIASGSLALVKDFMLFKVDGEGSAADDLSNIVTGTSGLRTGMMIGVQSVGPNLTLKHLAGGTGQISLRAGADYVLRGTDEIVFLVYLGTTWYQILVDYTTKLRRQAGFTDWATLTPASNVVTPTNGNILIDSASAVDVNQIARTNHPDLGEFLWVGSANATYARTLKHNQGTNGRLIHNDNADIILDSTSKYVVYRAATTGGGSPVLFWQEVARFGFSSGSSGGDGFGGNGSRSLPTSGSISGDYYHDGDWTATGALTIASDTRIFVRNASTFDFSTFNHVVSTRPNSGGKGRPTSGNYGQNIATGSGPGAATVGGGAGVSVVAGPGGAGFGGRGGRGGSYSNHFMPGGAIYSPRQFFGGTGGNSGMHYASTSNAAPDGGEAGGALYLEISLNPGGLCTLGNLNLNGGAGTNAPTTNYSGSAGASGGCFVARIRGEAILPAGRTISVNGGAGGGVGSGGTANAAAGGGGAGVIDIEATTWTNSGTLQANGGAAGSGGSYTASAGESSTPRAVGTGVNPCSFF